MDLAALSASYGNFYAPTFYVYVDGGDLMRDHHIPVSQVEVDLKLQAAGHFNFTVVDTFSFKDHSFLTGDGQPVLKLLNFGARVEIRMGYGDRNGTRVVMRGMIAEVTANYPDGGSPELSVSGFDSLFPLLNGDHSQTWRTRYDSDAVTDVAARCGLALTAEPTDEEHPQIEQNHESDFQFILKLADRNYFKVYVEEDEQRSVLWFVPPNDLGDPVVTMAWGEGLLSFRPSANLAGQVGRAEVYAYDPKGAKKITGLTDREPLTDMEGKLRSAADLFQSMGGEEPVLRMRHPVFTQTEVTTRSLAALKEKEEEFLTGDCESIGLPDIRPDYNVELTKLGVPFSRIYYVEQATHRVDSNGYRTSFKVKQKT
jgi:phage protein D